MLHRHYAAFLAVLVTGVVLITAGQEVSESTALYVECLLGVAGLLTSYVLTPPTPPADHGPAGPQ
ncbi:hypothetical protein ACFPZJ_00720 [Streptomyces bullii]|uniref:Uncharacterized protein n=1 Tax=Streptomyces bullii TaxID=349910 RepID=A0ABW0UFG9_9ACTN